MAISNHTKKMNLTITNTFTVKPAGPTPTGRQALAEWDQIGAMTHVPTVYFYNKPSAPWLDDGSFILTTLVRSLRLALVPFYPLAGRVHHTSGGRLELECNARGVRFVEAESDWRLEDFGDEFSPSPELESLVPELDYDEIPIHEWPLLLLQLTRYQCGGISLSFSISHLVVDGLSALHFFSEWARIARGEPIKTMPFLDRTVLRAGMPPGGHPKFVHTEFDRPPGLLSDVLSYQKIEQGGEDDEGSKNVVMTFKLAKTKVAMLKDMVNHEGGGEQRPYSTYETLTAHVWKCTCKARDLSPEQPTALGVSVDSRSRTSPPLPRGYFGNAILDVKALALSGELTTRPLKYAVRRIREAIEKVDEEFLDSAVDFLKSQPDLRKYQDFGSSPGPFFEYPNLSVISWLRLPLFGMDFGWGKEIHMGPASHDFDGDSLIMASQNGDGSVVVAISLREDHMESFKKCFYEDIM
ncbi:unnamed protein product [Linum tenue]|uniref:Uncharacterized protein n=1 Tax=Linum tenue TaxID=586396 RepID=A0AAV0RGG2_9ROSI|nr:unnamed protein product [Linum tenue]